MPHPRLSIDGTRRSLCVAGALLLAGCAGPAGGSRERACWANLSLGGRCNGLQVTDSPHERGP